VKRKIPPPPISSPSQREGEDLGRIPSISSSPSGRGRIKEEVGKILFAFWIVILSPSPTFGTKVGLGLIFYVC